MTFRRLQPRWRFSRNELSGKPRAVQWPTVLTLVMFPILVWMYVRLARREEREARAEFGEVYARYAAGTPAFSPRLRRFVQRRA